MRKWLIAVLLVMAVAVPVRAQEPLNSDERRTLTAKAADRLARRDLLSILKPMGRYPHGNRRQIGSAWFTTATIGTHIPGLCARNTLILNYAPVSPPRDSEHYDYEGEPLRPSGVEAMMHYRFVKAPAADLLDTNGDHSSPSIWRSECRSLKDDEYGRGWFAAPDPEAAVRGWLTFEAAIDAVLARPALAEPCAIYARHGQKADCAMTLVGLRDAEKLNEIAPCGAPTGKVCHKIDIDHYWITIIGRQSTKAPELTDIESVKVEEYITVT